MKQTYTETSNANLNVPMTAEQWDAVSLIAFESETAIIYPFSIMFDNVTMEMIDRIVELCDGHTDDTDILYDACESVLGTSTYFKWCGGN